MAFFLVHFGTLCNFLAFFCTIWVFWAFYTVLSRIRFVVIYALFRVNLFWIKPCLCKKVVFFHLWPSYIKGKSVTRKGFSNIIIYINKSENLICNFPKILLCELYDLFKYELNCRLLRSVCLYPSSASHQELCQSDRLAEGTAH